jgi:hypothetical protein
MNKKGNVKSFMKKEGQYETTESTEEYSVFSRKELQTGLPCFSR